MNNTPWLDGALYPDVDVPDALETLADRVDFLARLCAAWDFGLLPGTETIAEIRREDWRPAVEACHLSPTWDSKLHPFETTPAWPRCELLRSCNFGLSPNSPTHMKPVHPETCGYQ